MKKLDWRLASAFTVVGLMAATGVANAAGFGLKETSASFQGTSFAGYGSGKGDLSTMFANPATMTTMKESGIDATVNIIIPSIKFTKTEATTLDNPLAGTFANTTGDTGGDSGRTGVTPSIYAMWSARPDLKLGLGITVPFGLKTEYNSNWVGRYRGVRSEIRSINLNPNLAYKLSEKLSVGAGLQIQYIQAKLSRQVDYAGTAKLIGANLPAVFGGPQAMALVTQSQDVLTDITGDDWSFGANLGMLYEFTEATRLGVFYRSSVSHKLRGKTSTQNRAAALANVTASNGNLLNGAAQAALGLPAGTTWGQAIAGAMASGSAAANIPATPNSGDSASAPLQTPESIGLSLTHDITPNWSVMGDLVWTHWSRLKNLRIDFQRANVRSSGEVLNWKDTVFAALGTTYKPHQDWKLKFGLAFDQGAADDNRAPRLPDTNRYWISAGADWNPMHRLNLSLGYSFLFAKSAGIYLNRDLANGVTDSLKGSFKSRVHVVALKASYSF